MFRRKLDGSAFISVEDDRGLDDIRWHFVRYMLAILVYEDL